MGDVIEFKKPETGWNLTGPAKCMSCKHEWEAVVPVGTISGLECCECGRFTGVMTHQAVSDTTWECKCGCDLFRITPENVFCASCGIFHTDF